MENHNKKEDKFDLAVTDILDRFAQNVSRRGTLSRLGQLSLGLLGITLLPNLPLDRRFVVEAQGGCTTDWRLCGMYGYFCQVCCGETGGLTSCPSCTEQGSYWTKCCPDSCGNGRLISYYDCCGDPEARSLCRGDECFRNPVAQPIWCNSGFFVCTIISVGPSCSV